MFLCVLYRYITYQELAFSSHLIGVNMKTTVNLFDFQRAFEELRPDNFTNEALEVLFDYFEEIEESTGEELEFDVIGICCEFSEDTTENLIAAYSIDVDQTQSEEEIKSQVLDYLADRGALIDSTEYGIVYRQF